MSRVYFEWNNREEMFKEFEQEPLDVEILYAARGYGSYEGSAVVIYREDGQLYQVHAYHCSCYGLEGQWDKEAFSVKATKHILENGEFYDLSLMESDAVDRFKEILNELEEQGYE